jgi:hypothetical protein
MGLFDFFKKKNSTSYNQVDNVTYSGGNGSTIENAIIINAQSSFIGIAAEYAYISKKHGERRSSWELELQSLIEKDGKHFDALHIKLKNGQNLTYYFDISMFFGK